jgi:hypothetical protein
MPSGDAPAKWYRERADRRPAARGVEMVLKFCANRIMAMQELQATGTMAVGFRETGCYRCHGIDEACPYYTPMEWVYGTPETIPPAIRAFIRIEPAPKAGEDPGQPGSK